MEAGAGQGCILSTLLLMILLQTCTAKLQAAAADFDAPTVAQEEGRRGAHLVAVADDMNILSRSLKGLQKMLDLLCAELRRAGWQLNAKKCVVMCFKPEGADREAAPEVRVDAALLPVVQTAEGFKEAAPEGEEEEEEEGEERAEAESRAAGGGGAGSGSSSGGSGGGQAQAPPPSPKTGKILGITLSSRGVVAEAHVYAKVGAARGAVGSLLALGLQGARHEPQDIAELIALYVSPVALYGSALLMGKDMHVLDMAWELMLTAAMGRDVGSGPRKMQTAYCQWLLGATPLATPTSALGKEGQMMLWARVITGNFGTSLSQGAMVDSWQRAWERFMPKGPTVQLPTVTQARDLQARTVGEQVLKDMLKTTGHRGLAVKEPWAQEDMLARVEEALGEQRARRLQSDTKRWEEKYGPAEQYRDPRVSRRGWSRFYALQAQPELLLVVAKGEGGQRCAGCATAAPLGREGTWARTHTLMHCAGGAELLEARAMALDSAAARVQGWAGMEEDARASALLGEELELVGGGRGRLAPEHSARVLGKLAGAAW